MGPIVGASVPPELLHHFLGDGLDDEFQRTASKVLTSLSARLANEAQRFVATEPPTQLGPYRVEAPIGRGGMGTVYRGVHATTGKAVAIKTAPAGSDLAHVLREEASALGSIDHRGVVQVYDHGVDHGLAWMAMQLVRGQTLREVFEQRWDDATTPLSPKDGLRYLAWMRDLALALHAMHEHGIVHRDVKPSNVMIAEDGFPYVIDFGLSLDVSTDPIVDALAGTVPYMSPEQVLAMTQLDGRSDIYSLAACFYELLSGRKLVLADERGVGVFREIAFGIVKPLSAVARSLPKGFDCVFAKALQKDPAKRHASAKDLATDLSRLLAGKGPVFAREKLAVAVMRRWPAIAGAGVVMAALLVVGQGWWERRAALAAFRAQCEAGIAGDAGDATAALALALRMQSEFHGDQEYEDLYLGTLTAVSPGLTRAVFQRAALVPTNMVAATVTGRVGAMAGMHLASGVAMSPETRIELVVQNAFYHLRSGSEGDALRVLRSLPEASRNDERVRHLDALMTLVECKQTKAGDATASRTLAVDASRDFANLKVDTLCCRAMLLLEASSCDRVGETFQDEEFGQSATPMFSGVRRPATMAIALARQEEMREALVRLDMALAKTLRETATDRFAANMVATLLALVRLQTGDPAKALGVIEDRLAESGLAPEAAERPAMVLIEAAAGFRVQVRQADTDSEAMHRVVVRFREAAEFEPQLAKRFTQEIGRGDSELDGPLRGRFDVVCAEFLDELMRVKADPKVYTAPILFLTQFAGFEWDARGSMDPYAHLALAASQCQRPLAADGEDEESASRVFWFSATKLAAQVQSWTVEEKLAYCEQFAEFSKRMTPPTCIEAEVALLWARRELKPGDPTAAAALREGCARWQVYRDNLGPSVAAGYLREICDGFLKETK